MKFGLNVARMRPSMTLVNIFECYTEGWKNSKYTSVIRFSEQKTKMKEGFFLLYFFIRGIKVFFANRIVIRTRQVYGFKSIFEVVNR